jgi:hypothetical protein
MTKEVMIKEAMTKEQFIKFLTDDFMNVPKFQLELSDRLENDSNCEGSHSVDQDSGKHIITLLNSIFSNFPNLLSVVLHECVHAGLNDILKTLRDSGQIDEPTFCVITERAAYLASENLKSILLRYTEICNAWEGMYKDTVDIVPPNRWKSELIVLDDNTPEDIPVCCYHCGDESGILGDTCHICKIGVYIQYTKQNKTDIENKKYERHAFDCE